MISNTDVVLLNLMLVSIANPPACIRVTVLSLVKLAIMSIKTFVGRTNRGHTLIQFRAVLVTGVVKPRSTPGHSVAALARWMEIVLIQRRHVM